MISRFPLKLLLSPHADAQLKQYQLCPACSHKAATDLVPLHPKVGVYMLRPPKTDTYMASVVAKFFIVSVLCRKRAFSLEPSKKAPVKLILTAWTANAPGEARAPDLEVNSFTL